METNFVSLFFHWLRLLVTFEPHEPHLELTIFLTIFIMVLSSAVKVGYTTLITESWSYLCVFSSVRSAEK